LITHRIGMRCVRLNSVGRKRQLRTVTIFDKDGPGMVGLVVSYIIFACILAAAFYVFV
jgi:hypothetical protein